MSSAEFGIRQSGGRLGDPADNRPLTEQEQQLVQRLFSDPFSFPLEFKSWLVSYLESSDLSLTMSSVIGLQKTLGITGAGGGTLGIFPAGLIFPYGGATAPTGSVFCDGGVYTTTLQPRLFTAIGYRYGGSGTSFAVPDLRGRVPVGVGPNGNVSTLGQNEGLAAGARSPQHLHQTQDYGWASEGITAGSDAQVHGATPGTEIGVHHHGPEGTRNDTPAYIALSFIIIT